ncbi:class I SAM-dependent methyltransferase [Haloferula sp. BvORR071]|uniref:class I SAM-dependent methyltransferase n=1 Tax=Haloferula sp. BvORR071 TaxID=1396141 RepID=UPI000551A434|nr:class I SAM-dependent methyltransferase [Haloferula sp. BvORR071]
MSRVALFLVLALASALAGWTWLAKEQAPQKDNTPPPAPTVSKPPAEPPPYTFAPATRDGIGKFFHGREIAQVMGHPAIGWLERGEREQEEAPSKAIAAIDLKPTDVIADIGAGSGYYSFRISPKVPQGKVVAVDIQQEMLDFLRNKSVELKITNVEPHLGAIDDLKLPAATLDAALMVDAYHEFSHPREMLTSLYQALKPGGRIFLLEFRAEDPNVPIKALHKMTEAQARLEFESLGFRFVSNLRPLPWQHFIIFERPR